MKYKVLFALAFCTFALPPVFGQAGPIPVNCALGQSLNQTLSRIRNLRSATVVVTGTCTEYVAVNGFDALTLRGAPGATLQQPATTPGNGLVPQRCGSRSRLFCVYRVAEATSPPTSAQILWPCVSFKKIDPTTNVTAATVIGYHRPA